jgi:DNA-binding NtrC family response regulator
MSELDENTFITHRSAVRQQARGARVEVIGGPDAPRELLLPPAGLTVGTGQTCTLRLADKRVSRNHLHISADASGFRVRDLGSSNGSFVDGGRIDDAVVPDGTSIQIGHTILRLHVGEHYTIAPASARRAFGALLGGSLAMREVFGVLERVASSRASVLISGETGTGKELAARALHSEGARRGGPFVALDCGAIAESLIESELFGHVRGAFTGAVDERAGAFERAHGGTLFLDELGELPTELQPKLLRVLESREVRKVGGNEVRRVDVRVVAGTNRDLEEMVAAGEMRADLYYRLAVVQLQLPPLRERVEDLPALIAHFLREAGVTEPGAIAGANLVTLSRHDWPGNVRELRNAIDRAVACAGNAPRFAELAFHLGGGPARRRPRPPSVDLSISFADAKERLIGEFEAAYLGAMLEATGGNVAETARRAGLNRRHLYDLLKKHGLRA